jgi:hypothetical protein
MGNSEIDELQERVHCYEKQTKDMRAHIECLKAELLESKTCTKDLKRELPVAPIDVAAMIIRETVRLKTSPIQKAFIPNVPEEYEIDKYSTKDLKEIAEHLLAYCNNQENGV